ncbi:N-methyl-D-aspartate receptor NMDAR2C subunit [Marinicella sp. S1101]|nr:N-methyl-D-aspartate receptor NMDAR2C subunit [Marinicella marina]MCX7552252.1 N-methyl-D-aspartate receptor NMDAR2C subunit [Marinicella marina]
MNKDRWKALMGVMGFEPSLDCYDILYAAYSEKHRFYHTAKHIDAMLKHFDEVKELAQRPNELELAIWFHDAIYKPFSKSNELDSAVWARDFMLANGADESNAQRVYDLIMATVHDVDVTYNNDAQLMVDIDLTILGTPPPVYDAFEKHVRKEYRWVPYFIYQKKRKQLLNSFLQHKNIYHLAYFREKFEDNARSNIKRAINTL